MSVELGVRDGLVSLFSVNKEIDVDISALAGRPPFRGRISEVGVAASNAGRLYRVVIKVPNPDGLIKSGMTATVKAASVAAAAAGEGRGPLPALICPSPLPGSGKNPGQTQLAGFVVQGGKAALQLRKTGEIGPSPVIASRG